MRLELLRDDHDLSGFDCGNARLNDWLVNHAKSNQGHLSTTCLAFSNQDALVGYYALSTYMVTRARVEGDHDLGAMPYASVPAILLGRLAIDRSVQGRRVGTYLLRSAVESAVRSAVLHAAAKLMVVDAIDDRAYEWYRRRGFRSMPNTPDQLYLPMLALIASFREAHGDAPTR